MADPRFPEDQAPSAPQTAPVPPSTVIVTERPDSGGRTGGWIIAIVALLIVLVAIWAFTGFRQGESDATLMKDNAITQAADKVGDAAGKVGDAASNVGTAAKNTADKAADTASSVTVTTGTSDQSSDSSQD